MNKFWKITIGIIIFILLIIFGGWIFTKFWAWFVLPVFTNLPLITVKQAVGLSTFLLFLQSFRKEENTPNFWDLFLYTFIIQVLVLIFGWIVFLII